MKAMKINGVRIKAEEIESAVQRSGLVQEALADKYGYEEKHELVLYFVVGSQGNGILPLSTEHVQVISKLNSALEEMLPRAYVPTMYVTVSSIPSTRSGKVDRKSLSKSLELLDRSQIDLYRPRREQSRENTIDVWSEILEKVEEVAADISHAPIDPQTTFQEAGLESVQTVMFARKLNDSFDISVPLQQVVGPERNVIAVAKDTQAILNGEREEESVDLLEMVEKHAKMIEAAPAVPTESTILLTGATGYLGIEILRQCLATEHHLVLLVRCERPEEGFDRLRRAATIAKWSEAEHERLDQCEIWPSDLGVTHFELSEARWKKLQSTKFAGIIHNGAKVNFLHTYHDLEAANVASTATLLSCASRSLFPSRLTEPTGYGKTKFVGEQLVRRAKGVVIHPWIIIGGPDGVANADDFVWRYVASSVGMGRYVKDVREERGWMSLTGVDEVAFAIIGALDGEERKLSSGLHVFQSWKIVVEVLGMEMEAVSEDEWLEELRKDLERKKEMHPLFSLSRLMMNGRVKGIGRDVPPVEQDEKERKGVEESVAANVRYLRDGGFFNEEAEGEFFGRSKN
ncbi:hypothetical protein PMZ80_010461 [Knufia obscura]|uniref:Carrier domain-containing protein n=1 Tax=Knufia obscura TaxID=1635080 RepID=A0ABR0RA01_9EURO|nr:hypothetical protein PMZ80_010461 [Knufia obscura]